MKILYFPGLAHVAERAVNTKNSQKYIHLSRLYDVEIYPYNRTPDASDAEGFDALAGSSFGGYFALNLAARLGITGIGINPSFFLDQRIHSIMERETGIDHIDAEKLISLKSTELLTANSSKLHIFMNMDDDVIEPEGIREACAGHGINFYPFAEGGHEAQNFEKDMLPEIIKILK